MLSSLRKACLGKCRYGGTIACIFVLRLAVVALMCCVKATW